MRCAGRAGRDPARGEVRGEGAGERKNRPDPDTCACRAWSSWGLEVGGLNLGEMEVSRNLWGKAQVAPPPAHTQVGAEQDKGVSVAAALNWALPVCVERRARWLLFPFWCCFLRAKFCLAPPTWPSP